MSLKNKWLEFYETNHSWLKILMKDETRPEAGFILGVVSALEPSLKEM